MLTRCLPMLSLAVLLVVASSTGCARLGVGRSSDLLNSVDPVADAESGRWRFEDRALLSERAPNARLALPLVPYGDYRIRADFTRIIGDGSFTLILPVGDRQVLLVIDGGAQASGLEMIDGRSRGDNPSSNRDVQIENNRRYRLEAVVRTRSTDGSVDVDLDGVPFIRWSGPQSALALPDGWRLSGPARLGLGSDDCVVRIHTVNAWMLTGQTTWVSK